MLLAVVLEADEPELEEEIRQTMNCFTGILSPATYAIPWIEELNPKHLQNSSGRIVRREEGATAGSSPVEMIYVKRKAEPTVPEPSEGEIWEDDAPF